VDDFPDEVVGDREEVLVGRRALRGIAHGEEREWAGRRGQAGGAPKDKRYLN
jgi:hypothetical protein